MTATRDPAASRFFILQIVRLGGAVAVLLGVLVQADRAPAWLNALPTWTGYILALAGMIAFFALPKMLARRWKSPKP